MTDTDRCASAIRIRAAAIGAFAVLGLFAGIAPAAAMAQTFLYTGGEQTFSVPANVTGVHIVAIGARGLSIGSDISVTEPGGRGAKLTADVPVPSGQTTLYVEVGGVGNYSPSAPSTAGGFDGGGGGADGGGGASDVRTVSCVSSCASGGSSASLASRLAVAGGGGGASNVGAGGDAGNADGSGVPTSLIIDGTPANVSSAGHGTASSDVTSYCRAVGDTNGEPGGDGSLGLGGDGYTFLIEGTPDSGGGGGGLYGGGGGAQCFDSPGTTASNNAGAGAGGSSGAPTGSDVSVSTDAIDPAEVIITASVPTVSAAPTLTGGLSVGDALAEAHGSWSSSLPVTGYRYQWERCNSSGGSCTAIGGATGQTYALTSADLGGKIRVQEAATSFYGIGSASTSNPSGVVGEPPISTAAPTITGTATQGQVLDETHGSWTDGPVSGFTYQWERCTSAGASCIAIAGALTQAYTLTSADVGSIITIQETASNGYGTSAPEISSPTSVVQAAAPPTASITGPTHAIVGRPVHFGAAISDSQGTPSTYRWTVGGLTVSTGATLDDEFTSKGTRTIALSVTDTAGNTFTTTAKVLVTPPPPLGTINATLAWTFSQVRKSVVIQRLTVEHVPVGASVVVICAGGGCPHARTTRIAAPRCRNAIKKCKPPTVVSVPLKRQFSQHHLARTAKITIRIVRAHYIGKVFVFSLRHPGTPVVSCLAPGSVEPGKGC